MVFFFNTQLKHVGFVFPEVVDVLETQASISEHQKLKASWLILGIHKKDSVLGSGKFLKVPIHLNIFEAGDPGSLAILRVCALSGMVSENVTLTQWLEGVTFNGDIIYHLPVVVPIRPFPCMVNCRTRSTVSSFGTY